MKLLVEGIEHQPMFIAELVNIYPIDLRFYNASRFNGGDTRIDPNNDMDSFVWYFPCLEASMASLISFDNPSEGITKLDLDMTTLVIHESMFPMMCIFLSWQAPTTRSNNTPTVA